MDPALWELLREDAGSDADEIEAIIRLDPAALEVPGVRIVSRFGPIATCRLSRDSIISTRERQGVLSLKASRVLAPGANPIIKSEALTSDPVSSDERRPVDLPLTGAGVVVGVIDWGCDFDHPDFKNSDGSTRLLGLWDQRDLPSHDTPTEYGYGAFHTRAKINNALKSSDPYDELDYFPADADPDDSGTHGTHVMGIAAGNGRGGGPAGVAPEADLVFVHLSNRSTGWLGNLGDSARILEAVDFISRTAGDSPWTINLSVGRHGGPHDGSTLVELAFDHLLRERPGRFIVQSTGNYRNKCIHSSSCLKSGEEYALGFHVDPADKTPNELEVWYSGNDNFSVSLESPTGDASPWTNLGERIEIIEDGDTIGTLYNRASDPNNEDNHIDLFLYPTAPPGHWKLSIRAIEVTDGCFHAWLERDDSCPRCQTRFGDADCDGSYSTGTLANSNVPLVVGAYDVHDPAMSPAPFSSVGPTRDGRKKPDLVAPGVGVLSAQSAPVGSTSNSGLYIRKSGTSMAAPHVTGAVALCMEGASTPLTSHEIRRLVLDTAQRSATGAHYSTQLGHGYLDVRKLIDATLSKFGARDKLKRNRFQTIESTLDHRLGPLETANEVISTDQQTSTEAFARFWQALPISSSTPDESYRAIVHSGTREFAGPTIGGISIVGYPQAAPSSRPRRGDLLLRVALGEVGLGRMSMLTESTLRPATLFVESRIPTESDEPGYYGAVADECSADRRDSGTIARRVLDAKGRLPAGQILLRTSGGWFDETAEVALADGGFAVDLARSLLPSADKESAFEQVRRIKTSPRRKSARNWASRGKLEFVFKVDKKLPKPAINVPGTDFMIWFLQKLYHIDRLKAIDVALTEPAMIWLEEFSREFKIGDRFRGIFSVKSYRSGLARVHGDDSEELKIFDELVDLQQSLSNIEYEFLMKWAVKARRARKFGLPVLSNLKGLKQQRALLRDFRKEKLRLLWITGYLEQYLLTEDEQGELEFDEIKDCIYSLDPKLVKKFAKLTGFAWSDLIAPVFTKRLEVINLEKELKKLGLSTKDLVILIIRFRDTALAKAVRMLVKSEEIVASETKIYKQQSELDRLVQVLREEFGPKFDAANRLLAKAITRIKKDVGFEIAPWKFPYRTPLVKSGIPFNQIMTNFALGDEAGFLRDIRFYGRIAVERVIVEYIHDHKNGGRENKRKIRAKLDEKYSDFKSARKAEQKAYRELRAEGLRAYPILADISYDFATLSLRSGNKIKKAIRKLLAIKGPAAKKTKERLLRKPDLVWELKPLILLVMRVEGITKDDNLGILILDKVDDVDRESTFKSLGLAALGIVLGIAGFFTGGATWLTAGLIAGAATVSLIDLLQEYSDYTLHSDAAAAAFDAALSVEPSAFGMMLASLGLVIDAVDVVKHAAKLIKPMQHMKNIDEVENAAGEIYEALAKETLPNYPNGLLKQGVKKEDFVESVTKSAKRAQGMQSDLAKLLEQVGFKEFDGPVQEGLHRIYDVDPGTFQSIIKAFDRHPNILKRLGAASFRNPTIGASLVHVQRRMGKDAALVFRYYGSIGSEAIDQLPDVMSVIIRGNITNRDLLLEFLRSRRLQKGLLAKADDPELFSRLWNDFTAKKDTLKCKTFLEYVGRRQVPTKLAGDKTIFEIVGPDFATLTTDLEKNLAILNRIDPWLAAELVKPMQSSTLDPKLHKKLNEMLSADIIKDIDLYKPARRQVINKVAAGASSVLSAADAKATRAVLQRDLPDIFKEHQVLKEIWDDAWKAAKSQSITKDTARNAWDLQRDRFWSRVAKNKEAKKIFENAGFFFVGSGAPRLPGFPGRFGRLSFDHVTEISQDWTKAVDHENLKFMISGDNTILSTLGRHLPDWPTSRVRVPEQ
ncbi:MAG: S8 family peptidase [Gammaproteobacteria bacterium]|nr:S8 family peptidase [Gammaproteobacteria bacterium]